MEGEGLGGAERADFLWDHREIGSDLLHRKRKRPDGLFILIG